MKTREQVVLFLQGQNVTSFVVISCNNQETKVLITDYNEKKSRMRLLFLWL